MKQKTLEYRISIQVPASVPSNEIENNIRLAIKSTRRQPDKELEEWKPIELKCLSVAPVPADQCSSDTYIGPESGRKFKSSEMSINEKDCMIKLATKYKQLRRKLDYPMKTLQVFDHDDEDVYDIPEDRLMKELKDCWPFDCMDIRPDKEFFDIHSKEMVKMSQLSIIRSHGVNIIVSPHYSQSGGTVMDLVDGDELERDATLFQTIR